MVDVVVLVFVVVVVEFVVVVVEFVVGVPVVVAVLAADRASAFVGVIHVVNL